MVDAVMKKFPVDPARVSVGGPQHRRRGRMADFGAAAGPLRRGGADRQLARDAAKVASREPDSEEDADLGHLQFGRQRPSTSPAKNSNE